MRQHLAAVDAARRVSSASVDGAALGSRALDFRPGAVAAGSYTFSIGTAGSACLVFQTVVPALLTASGPSQLALEGGTHNPKAPPFDFLDRVFLPLLRRMGPSIDAVLERYGFYPAGGGRVLVDIDPCPALAPIALVERLEVRSRRARAILASLPEHIATRELAVVCAELGWAEEECEIAQARSIGPGNALVLEVAGATAELVVGFGEKGVPAEEVARAACAELAAFLAAGVPVGVHLADQLLLPLALAGGGEFLTGPLSEHATSNIDVIHRFGVARIATRALGDAVLVEVSRPG
jgi:RNA 3'-terminal phosphate cyclase (ATP)